MAFTATVLSPTAATTPGTRATVDGDWEGVTTVAVQIGSEVKAYRVTPSADHLTATLSSDDPYYWKGTDIVSVSAWWPCTDGETAMPAVVVQADQSGDGYAKSDHIAVAEEQLHYNGGIPTLAFTHCTARISLTLSGSTSDVSSVRLTNLSTADGNPGEITAHHAGSGIIYEALVAPLRLPDAKGRQMGCRLGVRLQHHHSNFTMTKIDILTDRETGNLEKNDSTF